MFPTKFTFVKTKSRGNFGELSYFSRRFEPLLKFIEDSNIESVPRILS
jgi:hypothetical protein